MDLEDFCKKKIKYVDAVINCAAIAPLPDNQIDHHRSIVQNVASCGAIVDFCSKNGIKKIIHFSSSAVYENGPSSRGIPASLKHELKPLLMYPVSKYLSEIYLESQYKQFNLDIYCIRLFNLYGPMQDYFRTQPPLLGYLIKNLFHQKPVTLYATKKAVRDYININDLIDFIIICLNKKSKNNFSRVNLGSGKSYSVYDLINVLESVSGKKLTFKMGKTSSFWKKYNNLFSRKAPLPYKIVRNEIDKIAKSDISDTYKKYNWKPKVTIYEGLKECLDYAKKIL